MFFGKNTFCVVTDIVNLYTISYATRMKLILPSWIHKCVAAKICLPFQKEDLFIIADDKKIPSAHKTNPRYPLARGVAYASSSDCSD